MLEETLFMPATKLKVQGTEVLDSKVTLGFLLL